MAKKKRKPKQRARWARAAELMTERLRAGNQRRSEEDLDELAARPVEPGSGCEEYGAGPYCYMKGCWVDGSTRVLRFRTITAAERAMAIGAAADEVGERDKAELVH